MLYVCYIILGFDQVGRHMGDTGLCFGSCIKFIAHTGITLVLATCIVCYISYLGFVKDLVALRGWVCNLRNGKFAVWMGLG